VLQSHPIWRSSARDNLFLGGDRELVLLAALLSGTLAYTLNLTVVVLGGIMWLATLHLLRIMAAADPKMRHVYLRHRRYKASYLARSTPFRMT
jgi:type IV secretion system protein VirB3